VQEVLTSRWLERGEGPDPVSLKRMSQSLEIKPLTTEVLWRRGIDNAEKGRDFLDSRLAALPDPFLLPDMTKAVSRLVEAIRNKETISIHGDYDVDGISGTALLVDGLRRMGAQVHYHIPLRLKDGYGLSNTAIQDAAKGKASIVLSVDCGVSAVEEASLALELGLDLIITDHHQPPESLPVAHSIVNPHCAPVPSPFQHLAGVGVAFFLLVGLRKVLRDNGHFSSREEPDLRELLDLVALGTIADVVPLQGVNRILTKAGLALMNRIPRLGIDALQKVAGAREITCGVVGFQLAPRLNAAGRIEDAAMGVELLLSDDKARAKHLAEQLDGFNRVRQQLEKETLQQAMDKLDGEGEGVPHSIVLGDSRWHPGVIGIVASRLVERFYRPVILVAMDQGNGKGSARSIPGFHLYRALQACEEYLSGYGGHEFAAGLTLDENHFESFARSMDHYARSILTEEDLRPCQKYDIDVTFHDLDRELVQELEMLAPFGNGNPEPVFRARGVELLSVEKVGASHLRWKASQNGLHFPCIAFGMAERIQQIPHRADILFTPTLNEWRGRTSLQLRVRDFCPSEG